MVCKPLTRVQRAPALPLVRSLLWLALAQGLGLAHAQEAPSASANRTFWVVPTFNASTVYSLVSGRTNGGNKGEFVTQLGPGLQVTSRSGRVQGSLDYSLLGTVHSERSESNTFNNSLVAAAKAEVVPAWMYVDARATISKQAVSAFGLQTEQGSVQTNNNQREVWSLYVSPYVRGELRQLAEYEFRLNGGGSNVRGSAQGDSTNFGGSATLRSPRQGTVLGWGLQGTAQRVDFKAGRATDTYRGTASVFFAPYPDLFFSLRGGQESTNVGAGTARRQYANWGAGARWAPSPRTIVSFDADKRYFGDSYQVLLEHRLRRSSIRFTSTRDATSGSDPNGVGQPTTLFQLLMRQYASQQPDPILRELQVRELLRLAGANPNTVVGGGFATSAVSLQRREDLSFSYIGLRTDFNLLAFASDTSILDTLGSPLAGTTRQAGLLGTVSHKLTPQQVLSLTTSYQRTQGTAGQPSNDLKSISLGLNTVLSKSITATAGARYSIFDGASLSNRETSLTASVSVRF
jgi:uncharacterized protein (PEP-CTERM system associated)